MESIEVHLPIRLGQFLKLAGLAENGAHAREIIESGDVRVNNECEMRRGRQLVDDDIVSLDTEDGTLAIRVSSAEQ